MDDFPKRTETILTVLHLTQARFVAITLVLSTLSISSFSQRKDPCSTLFLSPRNSSLINHTPLHAAHPSNLIEKTVYSLRFFPHAGQTSEVPLPNLEPMMGSTST